MAVPWLWWRGRYRHRQLHCHGIVSRCTLHLRQRQRRCQQCRTATLTPGQVVVNAPLVAGGVNPFAVPSLSGWALALRAALMGGVALVGRRAGPRKRY
ncbi:hypothetical protein [Comamonas koreensis]|uniref:hypothetical protein n=1 Tax=Comamonas koreensis TaxID=160825 RepID=UPI0038B3677B